MIKPEILKMVEECEKHITGKYCLICKHKKLCKLFKEIFDFASPRCVTIDYLSKLVSFLTSQEVCECEEWKEFKSKYVDIEGETWIAKVDDIETQGWYKFLFCPFCGGKIKKGE